VLQVRVLRGVSSEHPKTIVPEGETAPEFELPALIGGVKKLFRLKEALGERNIVLAFYPLNWNSLSARQLVEYQAEHENFTAKRAEVVGISVDSIMNTTEWEREIGPFEFPLCSDFWPHGEVSQAYGVFREHGPHAGTSERAIVVINRRGKITFSKIYDGQDLPRIADMFEALRNL
jgi:mycoredoxin-dependent peroxiredoxin